jgi:hypothetical protein
MDDEDQLRRQLRRTADDIQPAAAPVDAVIRRIRRRRSVLAAAMAVPLIAGGVLVATTTHGSSRREATPQPLVSRSQATRPASPPPMVRTSLSPALSQALAGSGLDLVTKLHLLGEQGFPEVYASYRMTGPHSAEISVASADLAALKSALPADGTYTFRRVKNSYAALERLATVITSDPAFKSRLAGSQSDDKTNKLQVVLLKPYSATLATAIVAKYGSDRVEVDPIAEAPSVVDVLPTGRTSHHPK